MSDTSRQSEDFILPAKTNFIRQGHGAPVILIHGMAASLHDWDELVPALVQAGYSAYALDLLGHGESNKPLARSYQVQWVYDHFEAWFDSLVLDQPPVLVGHSFGGYLALELARRFPTRVQALVLVNPFYRLSQLPALLRFAYENPVLNMTVIERAPAWLLRLVIDMTSLSIGHSGGGLHQLPRHIRAQTAMDYSRTSAGVYHLPNSIPDLTPFLNQIEQPSLLVWGGRDRTLKPSSFSDLTAALPQVTTRLIDAGHVPHQSHASEFSQVVLDFLRSLPPP
jgi:pimeloyl-ACP methyl ester carboxylesterase